MSLGLAMSSGAMGQQAQGQYNKSMIMVFGMFGGMFALGAVGYGVYRLYDTLHPEETKKENQKYVQQAGRRTRRKRRT